MAEKRPYSRSGFYQLRKAMAKGGVGALDGRTSTAKAIAAWRADIEADLGADLSAQERTVLDVAAGARALLAVADAWIAMNPDAVVNRRKRQLAPIVADRVKVAAHLADMLKLVGLKRRVKDVSIFDLGDEPDAAGATISEKTATDTSSTTDAQPAPAAEVDEAA